MGTNRAPRRGPWGYLMLALLAVSSARAQESPLSPQTQAEVDASVQRALDWLASRQQPDGAFPTQPQGQPGATALCALAFLAAGELPGQGPRGHVINRAVSYVMSCQKPDGLISNLVPGPADPHGPINQCAQYNHAIAALLLTECYGMTSQRDAGRVRGAIEDALAFTLERTPRPKRRGADKGGWRYINRYSVEDSDLSITSWQLMFLRSARNAGFDVPTQVIDEGMTYVMACYQPQRRGFSYLSDKPGRPPTRAMSGAGVLSLSMAGMHRTPVALEAGQSILAYDFARYNQPQFDGSDRYHYGAFYCTLATYHLGQEYFARFYPPLVQTLLQNQRPEGCWSGESGSDSIYGNDYTTSLVVLTLTAPRSMLPIFQR